MEQEPKQQPIESQTLYDFGYWRIVSNLAELDSFDKLEAVYNDKLKAELEAVRAAAHLNGNDIPLRISLPQRPPQDLSMQDLELSLAELAGAATAITLLTVKKPVFMNEVGQGSAARELFKVIDPSPENNLLAPLAYLSGTDLAEKFDVGLGSIISTRHVTVEIGGGRLHMDVGSDLSISNHKQITKADLHALKGFAQVLDLFVHTHSFNHPPLKFEGEPLFPYSARSGTMPLKELLKIDRIKSYAA